MDVLFLPLFLQSYFSSYFSVLFLLSADDLMARMKAKAERTSAEADAAEELAETFGGGDALEKEFEDLGSSSVSPDIQDKLAAMKADLGQSTG